MSPSTRSDHPSLGHMPQPAFNPPRSGNSTANTSPTDTTGNSLRSPYISQGLGAAGKMAGATRSGAGSPSHEIGGASRLFSKRAREIQAQEGLPVNVWGPPTSGGSTPLRENIPESPTDGFPDFVTSDSAPSTRRARAGTVPSRFSPGGDNGIAMASVPSIGTKTSRPSPSPTPYKSPSPNLTEFVDNAGLLSRLRAGSMPQRSQYTNSNAFGPAVFSTNWASGRERTSTLASIASQGSNGLSSPAQSSFSKDNGDNDMHMRGTLDYLGLADTPTTPRATMPPNPFLANIADFTKQANRFRSYSVNAKEQYAADEDEEYDSGTMTPYEQQAHLQMQLAATNAAIQQHNLAVQAYANSASANRPRARTAGVLESPTTRLIRNYYPTASRLEHSISAAEFTESPEYENLPEAVAAMHLGRSNSRNDGQLTPDDNLEGPTRALWLGSIPPSTTVSTLTEMFKSHGAIISARVLTHKNCGFVNFERQDSAVSAKAAMNGKEIFPGAGPVRINFAKPPSPTGTPGHDGSFPSPSPDPFSKDHGNSLAVGGANPGVISRPASVAPKPQSLIDIKTSILNIVGEFGASDSDKSKISQSLEKAISYNEYQSEVPSIQEPTHSRFHDAPKLRDIRKRIDNQNWSAAEIENVAMEMLPEIAELSSDYLGNTVVQKLFEHCSDDIKDLMLAEIAPRLAEIGVHKNGTWAAQKIIKVCKTQKQKRMIIDNVRPYTVPLFLDQFGNYVLQCCLEFGAPYNDFIFEAMLSQMWDIAQGRFGARAMRACLESHHSTKDQQRMLAAAIALNSVQLATNANGALLLTWFLDTCTFPQRRSVLAPQLVPHLVHLCTHKLAYLTVLKVINQKLEAGAKDSIFQSLFFSQDDQILEQILSDHACGATLIFKVLTTPFFDESIRAPVVEKVRNVLLKLKAQPGQGYKRLMDEVNLSTRNGSTGPTRQDSSERPRPGSNHSQMNAQPQFGSQFFPQISQPGFDLNMGMQRTDSIDSALGGFAPGSYGIQAPIFPPGAVPSLNLLQAQYQQQAALLAQQQRAASLAGFYPQASFGGFNNPSPSVDHYRNQGLNGSPLQAPQQSMNPGPIPGFAVPPGFAGMGTYGYGVGAVGQMPGMTGNYAQQDQGRRGRR